MPTLDVRKVPFWKPSQTPFSYLLLRGHRPYVRGRIEKGYVTALRRSVFAHDDGEFKIFDEIEHF